jgi:carbamoylphosphate synthase small subunit
MEEEGIPGIAGIDTRALTQALRERGVMAGQNCSGQPVDRRRPGVEDSRASIPGR